MALVRGRDGEIRIASDVTGSALGQLKSWSLDHSVSTTDVSTMALGATTAPYIPTQLATTYTCSGQATCYFDATSGGDDQILAITNLVAGTTVALYIYTSTNEKVIISQALITQASLSSSVDGLVELTISFTSSGGTVTQITA